MASPKMPKVINEQLNVDKATPDRMVGHVLISSQNSNLIYTSTLMSNHTHDQIKPKESPQKDDSPRMTEKIEKPKITNKYQVEDTFNFVYGEKKYI